MTDTLARVPCTIVTGFLGAGKTTLIRHVLANAGGRRLAVIVNEFGDVGIDGEILKGCGDAACPEENIVELANGCLCCTVADEFVPALDTILARKPRAHRHRDLGSRAAQATGPGVPLAGDQEPGHGRWRGRGGRRRGARRGSCRRRPRGAGTPARRRRLARSRRSRRGGVRGSARLRRPRRPQQARLARCRRPRERCGGDLPRAAACGEGRRRGGRQGRPGGLARPRHRHRGRHREPPHPPRRRAGARPRRLRQLRRAAPRDRRAGRARQPGRADWPKATTSFA